MCRRPADRTLPRRGTRWNQSGCKANEYQYACVFRICGPIIPETSSRKAGPAQFLRQRRDRLPCGGLRLDGLRQCFRRQHLSLRRAAAISMSPWSGERRLAIRKPVHGRRQQRHRRIAAGGRQRPQRSPRAPPVSFDEPLCRGRAARRSRASRRGPQRRRSDRSQPVAPPRRRQLSVTQRSPIAVPVPPSRAAGRNKAREALRSATWRNAPRLR